MIELFKGDSSELVNVRPDIADNTQIIDGNWVCQSWVNDKYGNEIIAPRNEAVKSADDLFFIVALSSADTDLLTVTGELEEYTWVIELTNNALTPAYEREIHTTVVVKV